MTTLSTLLTTDIHTPGVPRGQGAITAHSPAAVKAIVDHLQGQISVLCGLVAESTEVMRTIEAESSEEAEKLQTLIQQCDAARTAALREHSQAATPKGPA